MEIASLGSFVFLLLLVSVGYLFIETLGKRYWYQDSLMKHKGEGVLERVIHYVLWGLWLNLSFVGILWLFGQGDFLEKAFNSFDPLAKALSFGGSELSVQIFSFTIFYFVCVSAFTYLLGFISRSITVRIKAKLKKYKK